MTLPNVRPADADPALVRFGGAGAVLSGVAFVCTVAYTFGYLASLGLSVELLDAPARLLPWIHAHTAAYMGLWGIFVLSLLLLLPAPLGLAEVAGRRRATTRVATAVGFAGIVVGLVGAMVNTATAPALGVASQQLGAMLLPGVLLLSDLMGSLGLYLRLLSEGLIGIWLGLTGLVLLRHAGWPRLGRVQIGVAAVTLVVALAKALYLADWEPFLGLWLAVAYLVLGVALLRARTAAPDRAPIT